MTICRGAKGLGLRCRPDVGHRPGPIPGRQGWVGKSLLAAAAACFLVALAGCPPPVQPVAPPPLRTTEEIVRTIESNAARLDRALWSANASVTARFLDRQRVERVYNLEGAFLYQSPRGLRLDLRPGVGDQVMQIGSNDDEYWVWIEPEMQALWWGRYRHLGRPCAGRIAVRPDQLVAALMLGGLPRGDPRLLGPARRFGNAYDILYYLRVDDDGDRSSVPATPPHAEYRLDREYWVERVSPYLVRVVQFRDSLGRVVTSALLDDYREAWGGGPLVPHTITMHWPLDEGRFTLLLAGLRGLPADKVSPRAFCRPREETLPAGIREVIQVDADCEPAAVAAGSPVESVPLGTSGAEASGRPPSLRAVPLLAWPPPAASPDWVGVSDVPTDWIRGGPSASADWLRRTLTPPMDVDDETGAADE